MTTAADKIQKAAKRQRKSWAQLSRETGLPAPWIRSFATGHIHKASPERIRLMSEALGLDYRELLALTDQLGAVEAMERSGNREPAGTDIARLAAAIEAQTAAINALAVALGRSAVERPAWVDAAIAEVQDTVLGGIRLASMQQASDERAHSAPPPQDR